MLIASPTPENVLQAIDKINIKGKSDFLILCGEEVAPEIPRLIELLNQNEISFCGGIFPEVISGNKTYRDSLLLLPVHFDTEPLIIEGLDSGNINIPHLNFPNASASLFILVDGLSNYLSKFTYCLYKEIGPDYKVFGSGTGYVNFKRSNCIFSKDGFYKDAAVVTTIKNPITQSIGHGWKPIAGPYIATKTTANILEQINWEPAFKIYKEIIEGEENIEITKENYYQYAKHYPFGVKRSNAENLIRDPVEVLNNDAIRFGAEIPSNSVLYLMKSDIENMLSAGVEVCKDAISRTKLPAFLLFADCISRRWILNEQFEEELDNIASEAKHKNIPVFGVISLGEISSASGALLDYHHKTIVVSILEAYE